MGHSAATSRSASWSLRSKLGAALAGIAVVAGLVSLLAPTALQSAALKSSGSNSSSSTTSGGNEAPDDEAPSFDELGRFVLRGYDTAKPFASFQPGLGGKFGVPMWVSASVRPVYSGGS